MLAVRATSVLPMASEEDVLLRPEVPGSPRIQQSCPRLAVLDVLRTSLPRTPWELAYLQSKMLLCFASLSDLQTLWESSTRAGLRTESRVHLKDPKEKFHLISL